MLDGVMAEMEDGGRAAADSIALAPVTAGALPPQAVVDVEIVDREDGPPSRRLRSSASLAALHGAKSKQSPGTAGFYTPLGTNGELSYLFEDDAYIQDLGLQEHVDADGEIAYQWDFSALLSKAKPKVGRNEPCTCGSGKKYKHCCGKLA